MENIDIQSLIKLRRELHAHPEIAGEEEQTAKRIIKYINTYKPDKIITGLGGHGVAAIFKGQKLGKRVLIRAELDALPIAETNTDIDYISVNVNKSHKCGHDGHMAMVAGLAQIYAQNRPQYGEVILLFQPAEEIGKGAKAVCEDSKFKEIHPDYAFSLHNIPRTEMGKILCRSRSFSSSVESISIKFTGKTSHAAEPEYACSSGEVIAPILNWIYALDRPEASSPSFNRIAITNISSGAENSYGTTAGSGELNLTLRARTPQKLDALKKELKNKIYQEVNDYNHKWGFTENSKLLVEIKDSIEPFKANINAPKMVELVKNSAKLNKLEYTDLDVPFPWGEDFGYFTNLPGVKAVMFGLGSGIETPVLHDPAYNFPDELIPIGISMFTKMINNLKHE